MATVLSLFVREKPMKAQVAQSVEQRPEKACVGSSILSLGTIFSNFTKI